MDKTNYKHIDGLNVKKDVVACCAITMINVRDAKIEFLRCHEIVFDSLCPTK